MHIRVLSLCTAVLCALVVQAFSPAYVLADLKVPSIIGDHMVLQQKQKNKIWGKADPGGKVTVSIAEQSHEATADGSGDWSVMLSPLPAGGPYVMTLKSAGHTIEIQDILVGEVWICSGQSNMQWTVAASYDNDLESLTADNSNIRMINYPRVGAQEPVWDHPNSAWKVSNAENFMSFSAVGYYFGRQLQQSLGVPVGLVNNAWGGSACEAWVNRKVLEAAGGYEERLANFDKQAAEMAKLKEKGQLNDKEKNRLRQLTRTVMGNQRPANIYNGVLKSHLGYGIKGAIWYQGESNAGRAFQYRELFPLMIKNWRDEWGQGDFPFYWVQLADFRPEATEPGDSSWAELREAQTMTLSLPNTGQAVIIDIGEGKDIHPRNKIDVGRRLARLALVNDYGKKIASQSPRYKSMEKSGSKIVLSFDFVDRGWRPFDVQQPVGFTIAGEDKKFFTATAKILKDGRIEVSSPEVSEPAAVRYGWADNPVVNMYDNANLPLTPFRTDDWPGITVNAK